MKTIVFDTETTGLFPGSICQLSYITIDNGSISGKNYYFSVDHIDPGAAAVNHLSVQKLRLLSNDKTFSDSADEIFNDLSGCDLMVAHNFHFDIMFLRKEFSRCGLIFKYKKSFCTMKELTCVCRLPARGSQGGYKYPSLTELVQFFKISSEDIMMHAEKYFGSNAGTYHDARYDAAATYLCYKEALKSTDQCTHAGTSNHI